MTSAFERILEKKHGKVLDPWSKRSETGMRHFARITHDVLQHLAGDDGDGKQLTALTEAVLTRAKVQLNPYKKAAKCVENIGTTIAKLRANDHRTRHCLLHLVAGEFSRAELVRHFGFKRVGWKAYKTARRILAAGGVGGHIAKPRQGRPPLPEQLQEDVKKYWYARSQQCSRRDGKYVLSSTKTTVALEIHTKLGVSASRALQLRPKCIRCPRRATDFCHCCHDYDIVCRRLDTQLLKLGKKYNDTFETAQAALDAGISQLEAFVAGSLQDAKDTLQQHVDAKNTQNAALQTLIADKENFDTLTIIADFKQDPQLGRGDMELDDAWHTFGRATVCGFALYFPRGPVETGLETRPAYVAVVSPTSDHTSWAAHRALEEALRVAQRDYPHEWARVRRIQVWVDCGKHFRCFVFCGTVLGALREAHPEFECGWNSFVEHHGKGVVDGFFGMLTALLKEEWKRTRVATAAELVDAYRKQGARRGAEVEMAGGVRSLLHFVLVDLSHTEPDYAFRALEFHAKRVPVLSRTYCLRALPGVDGVLDCGFSDRPVSAAVLLKCSIKAAPRPQRVGVKVALPAPLPRRTDLTKLAAKFDTVDAKFAQPSSKKRPRLADARALGAAAFDLALVQDPVVWAERLARTPGMQLLYKDSARGAFTVGTVIAELTADERAGLCLPAEPHVFLRHFHPYGTRARVMKVEDLASKATAGPPEVRFLRDDAGERGPAYIDFDM